MTKAEIVKAIADESGIEKTQVLAVVEAFMEVVKKSLMAGELSGLDLNAAPDLELV